MRYSCWFSVDQPKKWDEYLRLFKENGISIRQISRLTGVSYYIVQKIWPTIEPSPDCLKNCFFNINPYENTFLGCFLPKNSDIFSKIQTHNYKCNKKSMLFLRFATKLVRCPVQKSAVGINYKKEMKIFLDKSFLWCYSDKKQMR